MLQQDGPEVSEEEGSYASRFCDWFLESSRNCLLLLVALPGLIDTLAQMLAMIIYGVATRVLHKE